MKFSELLQKLLQLGIKYEYESKDFPYPNQECLLREVITFKISNNISVELSKEIWTKKDTKPIKISGTGNIYYNYNMSKIFGMFYDGNSRFTVDTIQKFYDFLILLIKEEKTMKQLSHQRTIEQTKKDLRNAMYRVKSTGKGQEWIEIYQDKLKKLEENIL